MEAVFGGSANHHLAHQPNGKPGPAAGVLEQWFTFGKPRSKAAGRRVQGEQYNLAGK